jgi:hypothetical protein
MLPTLAEGDANKVFVIPSEFANAFDGIGAALRGAPKKSDDGPAALQRPAAPPGERAGGEPGGS